MPDWSDQYHNCNCYIRLYAVHQGLGRHVTIDKFVRMHSEKHLDDLMSCMSQKNVEQCLPANTVSMKI